MSALDDAAQELAALLDVENDEVLTAVLEASVDVRPRTKEELWGYIALHYGFKIPRVGVCPGHCAPFDAMADLYFCNQPEVDTLWAGGRGSGKTLDLAIIEHMLMTHCGDTIGNVAALEEQAQACYRYIQSFDAKPRFRHRVRRSIISRTEYYNGASLKIMPATPRAVNSAHPRLVCWDEVDQITQEVLNEGGSMPITVNGRPPQAIYTSSLKYAYGPMVRMMDQATAGEKALRVMTWCVFEIIQRCEPERHRDGEGCKTCPLREQCLDTAVDGSTGKETQLPGPGRAARADGFMPIDDVIKKFRTLDEDTLKSQWLSQRPSMRGLVYPQFNDKVHVIKYAERFDLGEGNRCHPALPVFGGIDFGFTNANVVIYLQVNGRKIIAFAEDYEEGRTAPELGEDIIAAPWYRQIAWLMGDPAAAGDRATLAKMGIPIGAADNTKDLAKDDSGISKVRWALKPMGSGGDALDPVLYIDESCRNLIAQLKTYHTAEEKDDKNAPETPVKKDDHAPDALRYGVARLIKTPGGKKKAEKKSAA